MKQLTSGSVTTAHSYRISSKTAEINLEQDTDDQTVTYEDPGNGLVNGEGGGARLTVNVSCLGLACRVPTWNFLPDFTLASLLCLNFLLPLPLVLFICGVNGASPPAEVLESSYRSYGSRGLLLRRR